MQRKRNKLPNTRRHLMPRPRRSRTPLQRLRWSAWDHRTHHLPCSSNDANALALLHAKMVLHCMNHTALARACWGTSSDRALALASCLKKACLLGPYSTHLASEHHESGSAELPWALNTSSPSIFARLPELRHPPASTEDVGSHPDSQVTPTWCLLPIGLHGTTADRPPPLQDAALGEGRSWGGAVLGSGGSGEGRSWWGAVLGKAVSWGVRCLGEGIHHWKLTQH